MTRTRIGIDPDTLKSGIAILSGGTLLVECLPFAELVERLRVYKGGAMVTIEAGWLISHNWHTGYKDRTGVIAKKGYDVGRNHQTGILIAEMCKHIGIDYQLVKPLPKCWHGKDKKITHEEFVKFAGLRRIAVTAKRTNQEMRDAGLIAMLVNG